MPSTNDPTPRTAHGRGPRHRARLLLPALAAAALLAPAPAPASAATWTTPASLSGPAGTKRLPDDRVPEVAVNRRGESLAAWPAKRGGGRTLLAAVGDARGRFGRPQRLGSGLLTSVAMADDGTAFVVWTTVKGVHVAIRRRNGHFGRAQLIARATSKSSIFFASVAVDRAGTALVAWTAISGTGAPGGNLVEVSRLAVRPRSGRFSAPRTIGMGGAAAAFDESGHIVASVVMSTQSGGTFPIPFSRTSVAQMVAGGVRGGPFSAPVTLSASPTYGLGMAIGNAGEIGMAWEVAFGPESDPYGQIQTTIGTAAGVFEAPVNAPVARAERSFAPRVAFGAAGELVTIWQEKLHRNTDFAAPLYWAARRPGMPFGPRQTLAAADITQPALASTGDGRALMVWAAGSLRTALYRSSGGFARATPPRGRPQRFRAIRVAARGDHAIVAWRDTDGRLRASVTKLPR
jgi:hypothetical protein